MFEIIPIRDGHGTGYYVGFHGSLLWCYDTMEDATLAAAILNVGLALTPAEA